MGIGLPPAAARLIGSRPERPVCGGQRRNSTARPV